MLELIEQIFEDINTLDVKNLKTIYINKEDLAKANKEKGEYKLNLYLDAKKEDEINYTKDIFKIWIYLANKEKIKFTDVEFKIYIIEKNTGDQKKTVEDACKYNFEPENIKIEEVLEIIKKEICNDEPLKFAMLKSMQVENVNIEEKTIEIYYTESDFLKSKNVEIDITKALNLIYENYIVKYNTNNLKIENEKQIVNTKTQEKNHSKQILVKETEEEIGKETGKSNIETKENLNSTNVKTLAIFNILKQKESNIEELEKKIEEERKNLVKEYMKNANNPVNAANSDGMDQSGANGQLESLKRQGVTKSARSEANIKQLNSKITNKKIAGKDDKKHIFGRMAYNKEIPEIKIINIDQNSIDIIVKAEIIDIEERDIREDLTLLSLTVFDGTSSIVVKKFVKKEEKDGIMSRIKEHKGSNGIFKIYGDAQYDNFAKEVTINAKCMIEDGVKEIKVKKDLAKVKRIELRAHTKMSQLDGLIEVKDLFKRAKDYEMEAVAITDNGVVQSFPDAMYASEGSGVKAIYGVDAYMAMDNSSAISFMKEKEIDTEYCVLDIETTGLSFRTDKITEFGIVKIKGGEIIDEFSCFVNPEMPIPEEVVKITNITDEMVKDAETIDQVMPKVLEFIGDTVLVAHNADFDIGFIRHNALELGYEFDNMYIDTLRMAKQIFPELNRFRLGKIAEYLGIEVIVAHRALDDVLTLIKVFNVMLERIKDKKIGTWIEFEKEWAEDEDAYKKYPMYNSTILVSSQTGMKNLYKLISYSHVNHYYMKPRILKSLFEENREGLIIGSGNNSGELYRAVENGKTDEELVEIAEFYDYLEVQPPENEEYKIDLGYYKDLEDAKKIIEKIVEIGKKAGKPVVATGDVYFLEPEDSIYRKILHAGQKKRNVEIQAKLHFRTTTEMLEQFEFLGKEEAEKIVVENSHKIYEMLDEDIRPISKEKATPYIDGCEDTIRNITYEKAKELYGETLPEIVEARLKRELDSIINNGFSVMYIIAQKLVHKSNEDGYIVGSRGSVGSSLVAFMTGITEVNSLKPHYRCAKCKYSDFSDFGVLNGYDLPDKNCPECGEPLVKDGLDIPFETFLGFKGNKEPDIDLNFSDEYQSRAHKYTEEIIGDGTTYKAGTIGTIAEKTAFGFVKGYFDDQEKQISSAEIARLAKGCTGVKRTTGQHPGGIIVVPAGREIYEFCPVQKPADNSEIDIITTHFDYHKIDHNLLKLDILGHLDPTMIRHLQDITGLNPTKIKLDDKKTMSIFSSTEALGVKPEDIGSKVGTYGVPEFGTKFVRDMLVETKPTTFEELIRISGLSHGTDVWLNNAQDLVKAGTATLSQAICTRDDIMTYLISKEVESETAFTIMESVRKGKGLKPEWEDIMREHNVPEWYITSCKTIKYMFPKAHAAAYVTNAFRIAWFKVHKPGAYYTAFFTVRSGGDFDATSMIYGEDVVKKKMDEIKSLPKQGVKEKGVYALCELVLEMNKRGIEFLPIDLYESHANKFKLIDDTHILPPLSSIPGLGGIAAENIYKAAQEAKKSGEPFFTREEIRLKCKVGNSVIEMLDRFGILEGIQETAQSSIFDML